MRGFVFPDTSEILATTGLRYLTTNLANNLCLRNRRNKETKRFFLVKTVLDFFWLFHRFNLVYQRFSFDGGKGGGGGGRVKLQ